MRLGILLLLFCLSARAGIPVDSLQLFTAGTVGSVITDAALNSGKVGTGTWVIESSDTVYHSWTVVSNAAVNFPNPVVVGGVSYPNTGTDWMRVYHTNNNVVESMGFQAPGAASGTFQRLKVRMFYRPSNTNSTINGNNLDHLQIDGNPFCVCQQQTGGGNFRLIAHAGGGNGSPAIDLVFGTLYYLVLDSDLTQQTCRLALYDGTTFSLVGTATGTLNNTGNVWWVRLQANYLDLGDVTGYTEVGGFSADWTALGSDLGTAIAPAFTVGKSIIGKSFTSQ